MFPRFILHISIIIIHTYSSILIGAEDGLTIHEKAKAALVAHDVTDENTLFAQSVCPDEINHEKGDITTLFSAHLGEVFHMGGLAGIPFTGKTGFTAFSHHVPDGNIDFSI